MSILIKLLIVAGGGATGTICRYLLETHFKSQIITLIINSLGSFLMGLFVGWLMVSGMSADRKTALSILLMSGFCGGFSTFAHFAMVSVNYLRTNDVMTGIGYVFITMLAGLLLCFAGFLLGSRFT